MQPPTPMTKAKIQEAAKVKGRIYAAGLTFAEIDRKYNLRDGAARDVLREPNSITEAAVAAALGTRPYLLWPTRYHASGRRRRQQDYSRPPTMAQRRKFVEAQT